jgi:two-component system, chemotaxis family, CheB/CheR fusion protein
MMDDPTGPASEASLRIELDATRHELAAVNTRLESTRQQLDRTHRDLHSAVGQLDATTSQLQAANQALATLNDDLASTSRALQSVNEELRSRTSDLDRANALLRSLFGSLRSAIVVLDRDSRVLAWNNRAAAVFGLRADHPRNADLLGGVGVPVEDLQRAIAEILAGDSDEQTLDTVATVEGVPRFRRLNLAPLRHHDRAIGGVLLLVDDAAGVDRQPLAAIQRDSGSNG